MDTITRGFNPDNMVGAFISGFGLFTLARLGGIPVPVTFVGSFLWLFIILVQVLEYIVISLSIWMIVLGYFNIRHKYFKCLLVHSPDQWLSGPVMDLSAATTFLAVPVINQALFVMFIYAYVISTCLKVLFAAQNLRRNGKVRRVLELSHEYKDADKEAVFDYLSTYGTITRIGWADDEGNKNEEKQENMCTRCCGQKKDEDDDDEQGNEGGGKISTNKLRELVMSDTVPKFQFVEFATETSAKQAYDTNKKPEGTYSGLKWVEVAKGELVNGKELSNDKLADALKTKTEFTKVEWEQLGVGELKIDHFIASSDTFFKPSDPLKGKGVYQDTGRMDSYVGGSGPKLKITDATWFPPYEAKATGVYEQEYSKFKKDLVQADQPWPFASSHALVAYFGLAATLIISCPTLGAAAIRFLAKPTPEQKKRRAARWLVEQAALCEKPDADRKDVAALQGALQEAQDLGVEATELRRAEGILTAKMDNLDDDGLMLPSTTSTSKAFRNIIRDVRLFLRINRSVVWTVVLFSMLWFSLGLALSFGLW